MPALALTVSGPVNSSFGAFWALTTGLLRGPAAAGGIALIIAIGGIGGFIGPAVMGALTQATGTYTTGMLFLAFGLLMSVAIVLALGRTMAVRPVMVTEVRA